MGSSHAKVDGKICLSADSAAISSSIVSLIPDALAGGDIAPAFARKANSSDSAGEGPKRHRFDQLISDAVSLISSVISVPVIDSPATDSESLSASPRILIR